MDELIQQGDVLVFRVDKIPENATPVEPKNGKYILAEGEATGHAHVIDVMDGIDMFQSSNDLFLTLDVETTVRHEEHKPVTLKPGNYKIKKVREVDPFTEEIKAVRD